MPLPMEHEQEAPGEELPLYEDWQWEEYIYNQAKEEEAGDTEKDGDAVMNDVKEDAVMEMPKEVAEEISSPEGLQTWYYIVPGGAYVKVMEMEDGLQLKRAPFEEGEEEWAKRECTGASTGGAHGAACGAHGRGGGGEKERSETRYEEECGVEVCCKSKRDEEAGKAIANEAKS